MAAEKALGLVLRTTDYSETSRIATIWTQEFGKVRVLAKGGRRLRSNFDSALDLLTVCSIVLLRKSSGGLDLLTEAQVVERFPRLRTDLSALYAAYYVAELLGDWTEDYDPHPGLFTEARETLRALGAPEIPSGVRLLRFETVLLRELGYAPVLESCANCHRPLPADGELSFSAPAGGVVCGQCQVGNRARISVTREAVQALKDLVDLGELGDQADQGEPERWKRIGPKARAELRRVFNLYVSHVLGRRPRTMTYLGS